MKSVEQVTQLDNPDARVTLEVSEKLHLLGDYSDSYQGVPPADFPRFGRCFWEGFGEGEWEFWQSTVTRKTLFGGREHILWMNEVRYKAEMEHTAYIRGVESWGKEGIVVSQMSDLSVTIATGYPSDTNVAVIIPRKQEHVTPIWCFCSSSEYNVAVRKIDQSMAVTNATLVKVPFDLERWTKIGAEQYPNGLPRPFSDEPTQWVFHGHPCCSVIWDENEKRTAYGPHRTSSWVLQVAVSRLLEYRWPAELDNDMELSDEARELVKKSKQLLPLADKDGIVCIPAVRGEATAAERLLNLLAEAYGSDWSNARLSELLKQSDHAGKTLDSWLREKFFTQHCKLFYHRPFIWHIWDGLNDGFAALVNYHKLDRKNLETLIYTYLGDWIKRQKDDKASSIDGADEKLAAAEVLKKRLELILKGEEPYDIFVRWKPIEKQPIGWEPDLNDGVRLNIRPFMSVPDVKKKGAGVLRDKPNIKWTKDRGKDVESAPWYNLGPEYGGKKGDRINDHHVSLAEKKAAKADK